MIKYDAIIIGFGKGGKTLALHLGRLGKKVALIEKSEHMYGGTCINVGCIPTKSLVYKSKIGGYKDLKTFEEKAEYYKKAVEDKNHLTSVLRKKNYDMLNENENIDIYNGRASFLTNTKVEIDKNETKTIIEGEKIFINTGSKTIIPNIDGINDSKRIYTSTTLLNLKELPKHLVVVGGGYIGLEFASIYAGFGSKVTVLELSDKIAGREDKDVSDGIRNALENRGVLFITNSQVQSFVDKDDTVIISYLDKISNELVKIEGDAVLVAIGRKPNIDGLNLDAAGVKVADSGNIQVDNRLKTSAENIWALGDVKGGLQFTYISLDDFRILKDNLFGECKRTTDDREFVPNSVFIEPTLAKVGLSEEEAIRQGYKVKVAKLQAQAIPRAKIIEETTGFMKAIVDAETNKILGCIFLCAEASELINIVNIAMTANKDYTFLRDTIFTHPTMSESLNDLFSLI